jgi:hypothetical protein
MSHPKDDWRWRLEDAAAIREDWATEAEHVAEGPFLLEQAGEAAYEMESGGASEAISSSEAICPSETSLSEAPGGLAGYEGPMIAESPPGEKWEGPLPQGLSEPDPYMAIRPALSPQHAHLTADEIAVSFGRLPAIIALNQALASPEPQRAALAVLLGSAGRRSTRAHGTNVAIPTYLRLLSRLCREAAEHGEDELEQKSASASAIRDLIARCTGPDVREVQKALNSRAKAGLEPDGVFGPLTRTAVINFQRANQLLVDGIVGPQTRHVLFPLIGVTLHAVGRFGGEAPNVASRGGLSQGAEAPPFATEDPTITQGQPLTDDPWKLLLPAIPSTDPADGTFDTFSDPSSGISLPVAPILTAPLLKIPGMKLDTKQLVPGFQLNTAPLWVSRDGTPNPSGSLVLALQSVLARHKDDPGHLEVAEGFQLGKPLFARTSDGRDWTLQWFAQATWVDPFWQRKKWHLVQPFAQISAQLDLNKKTSALGAGLFPVNVQFDIVKDKVSAFLQGGLVAGWDIADHRLEIGPQVIGGVNISFGGK